MRARITKRVIDSLKAIGREYFRWNVDLPGYGVRVQPSGTKSYVVKYRAGSGRAAPTRRMTIGSTSKLTPDQARIVAKKILGAVAHGADPATEKAAERQAETLRDIADLFLTEDVDTKLKSSTAALYRDILHRLVLPELGQRRAGKIAANDLARLHLAIR